MAPGRPLLYVYLIQDDARFRYVRHELFCRPGLRPNE
jgi:hypothetical protein